MRYRYVYRYGCEGNPVPRYRKKYMDIDGLHLMLTRYTHEVSMTNHWPDGTRVTGPRGGRAVREFARYVWYSGGRFYRIVRSNVSENEFVNVAEPIDGLIWDCHVDQSVAQRVPVARIQCVDGQPVSVTLDGEAYEMDDTMWPMCEEILYLDGRRCPNGRIVAIHADAVA